MASIRCVVCVCVRACVRVYAGRQACTCTRSVPCLILSLLITWQVLSLSYQAEQLFTGLSPKEMLAVAELRVVAHVILLLNTPTLCR